MNNEIFSYIGVPLNELNKELKIQDQRVVLLFSYIFNTCVSIDNQISDYNNKVDNLNSTLLDVNDHISKIEFRLGKIDKKINNIVTEMNIKNDQTNTEIQTPKTNIFKKIWDWICIKTKRLYKLIYGFIFKKYILKQQEKKRLQQIEEENKRIQEQKERIKKILNNGH